MPGENGYDYEEIPGDDGVLTFSEKSIRLGFIRKVYLTLMFQLAVTSLVIALIIMNQSASKYFRENQEWLFFAFVVSFGCMLVMACFESARRTAPTNYIFLFIFTIAEGFFLGVICSSFQIEEVLLAAVICAVVCFALTLYAFQTKTDFTMMGGILFVACSILIIFGILLAFIPSLNLIYTCSGAFLFSIYLIYDTQLMIGGKHKYAISPEEYIFASLCIYMDIVEIFLFILRIIAESSRQD